jgi:hypothetical protein
MNLRKIRKVFTSEFVGTRLTSYEKIIYWAAVSQRLRNASLHDHHLYLVCPDMLSLVGEPLSGDGYGSPNRI